MLKWIIGIILLILYVITGIAYIILMIADIKEDIKFMKEHNIK